MQPTIFTLIICMLLICLRPHMCVFIIFWINIYYGFYKFRFIQLLWFHTHRFRLELIVSLVLLSWQWFEGLASIFYTRLLCRLLTLFYLTETLGGPPLISHPLHQPAFYISFPTILPITQVFKLPLRHILELKKYGSTKKSYAKSPSLYGWFLWNSATF